MPGFGKPHLVRLFYKDWALATLRKIHIASEPELFDGKWSYKLIAVFNVYIAILNIDPFSRHGDGKWGVLMHTDLRSPRFYVDAVWGDDHIFVVSDDGSVYDWLPFRYG